VKAGCDRRGCERNDILLGGLKTEKNHASSARRVGRMEIRRFGIIMFLEKKENGKENQLKRHHQIPPWTIAVA
jgi:hypothetical protein